MKPHHIFFIISLALCTTNMASAQEPTTIVDQQPSGLLQQERASILQLAPIDIDYTTLDPATAIQTVLQVFRQQQPERMAALAQVYSATSSSGGNFYLDCCCAPPDPENFTISTANTVVTINVYLIQAMDPYKYFNVKITGQGATSGITYYNLKSSELNQCMTVVSGMYQYNCSRSVTLQPGNYTISFFHSEGPGDCNFPYIGECSYSYIEPGSIMGNTQQNPIVVGNFNDDFDYNNTKNTADFHNFYTGQATNDVFYKFTLTAEMDVVVKHCSSTIEDRTYLHLLDANSVRIAYNDGYSGTDKCDNALYAYIKKRLGAGTYYVVSEGYSKNGNITTTIEGTLTYKPGNTRLDPIVVGSFNTNFQYDKTLNTAKYYTNDYVGRPTNDVFYQFTLTTAMDVVISHCGSTLSDTYLHLLDANGARIGYNDNYSGEGRCQDTGNAYLRANGLAPGTYYVVSEGNNQNGIIKTNITGNLNIFGYPGSPEMGSSSPEAVGSIPGVFDVSGSGAATYTIPIEVPKGVGGMQPSLAITYNSQSGNGVAGFGCNLSGISAITRAPKNIYHDSIAMGLTHDKDEAYLLNGQRLILASGTAGIEGAVYYTESDPYTKVLAHGTTYPNIWFEVIAKDGTKCYYGNTAAGRQTYPSGSTTRVNAWYLDYVEDVLGNYMKYSYNMSSYMMYLASISYGKNKNETSSFENTVTLAYTSRPDDMPFLLETTKGFMYFRLSKITCKTGNSVFREYTLAYNADKFSRLQSVTQRNGEGASLSSSLSWSYLPAFSNVSQQCLYPEVVPASIGYPSVDFANQTYVAADMDGDGLTDLIGIFPYNTETNPGSWESETRIVLYKAARDDNGQIKFSGRQIANFGAYVDFGDLKRLPGNPVFGKLDRSNNVPSQHNNGLVLPHFQQIDSERQILFYYITENFTDLMLHSLTGARKIISNLYTHTAEPPVYTVADLNNDGKDVIISIEKDPIRNQQTHYTCRIRFTPGSWTEMAIPLNSTPKQIFAADFNGNGMTDLMFVDDGNYYIYWNQGNGSSNNPFSESNKTTGATVKDCAMIRMGDFNGDGLPDFLMNEKNSNGWYFAFNNGNGTFTKEFACLLDLYDQDSNKDDEKFSCHVFDFDHDGKSDVVITKTMFAGINLGTTHTKWMRYTGLRLVEAASAYLPPSLTTHAYALSKYYVSGDFDGDGNIELMNYGYNCYDGSIADWRWRMYKSPDLTANSGKVTSISDGYVQSTHISYAMPTNTKENVYTKGTGSTHPLVDLTVPLPVVKSVTTDNGMSNPIVVNYSYAGLKAHLMGRGLLGFTSVKANHVLTGATVESGISQLHTTYFVPEKTYTKTTIGGSTAESTVQLKFVSKGGKRYFAHPETATEKDLDGNTTTTTYVYDVNGNPTSEKTIYDNNPTMYRQVVYSDYVQAGGTLPHKPQTIIASQKHADDGAAYTNQTTLTYHPGKGYPTQKVENAHTGTPLTTDYTSYDAYGNLLTAKVSGSGIPTITYYTVYDATKRFVAKQYTSPASAAASYLYDTWGNLTKETDETNPAQHLATMHSYDGWGREILTTLPDGRKIGYYTGWGASDAKKYYTLVQATGEPWVKTWYDKSGREVASESIGPKGLSVATRNIYTAKGELFQKEQTTGNLVVNETFFYDARGRVTTQNSSSGASVTYSYGKRSVTTTTGDKIYTKTYDAWGNIVSATDRGGTVDYTYTSLGKPGNITVSGGSSENASFSMTYDAVGNQKTLLDPNAGLHTYHYDILGRVISQIDGKSQLQTTQYDALGRVERTTLTSNTSPSTTTNYTYVGSGNGIYQLEKVQAGTQYASYTYDAYGRPVKEKRQIDGSGLVEFTYAYNNAGQLQSTTYPDNVVVSNEYDPYGNLVKVQAGAQTIWELNTMTGTATTASLGGGAMATTTQYSNTGLLTNLKTMKGSTVIRDFGYTFDGATGNLTSRTGMVADKETFRYDNVDRLEEVLHGVNAQTLQMKMKYAGNGNITSKTGLGTYSYGDMAGPHAVTGIQNTGQLINSRGQKIEYTAFHKASLLRDTVGNDAYELAITYGPDRQRWRSELKKNNSVTKTITFAGNYEKVTENGVTQGLYYIAGDDGLAAIYVKQAGQSDKVYYTHTDHLGSIVKLTEASGTVAFQANYDAWGKQTVTTNTFKFHRGYTGHEHLPEFGLINMNGRMYNPIVGRFLSPDPFVQAPDFTQSFNRYSYCWNNPLMYSDPSGEFIQWLIPAIKILTTMYMAGAQVNFWHAVNNGGNPFNPGDWNWSSPWTYVSMATAGYGAFMDVGGLNAFKSVSDAASTTAAATSYPTPFLQEVADIGRPELPSWLNYRASDKFNLFAGPGRARYLGDDTYWVSLREVIINGWRPLHKTAIAQSIYAGQVAFWSHPIAKATTTVLTSMIGGGLISSYQWGYKAVQGIRATKGGIQIGQSFGKLGTVVENPGLSIANFSKHGLNQAITRGVNPSTILNTVKNPVTVLQQSGGNYLYLTREAAVVMNPTGRVVSTYPASMFDSSILNVLKGF